ncbi:hypothetical protein ACSSS7_006886 [Eimeria intestinalis]
MEIRWVFLADTTSNLFFFFSSPKRRLPLSMGSKGVAPNKAGAPGGALRGPPRGPHGGPHATKGAFGKHDIKNQKHHRLMMKKQEGAPLRKGSSGGDVCVAAEGRGPPASAGRRVDKPSHLTSKKHNKNNSSRINRRIDSKISSNSRSSSSSKSNRSKRKLPQWVVAALKAGEEAKGKAAEAAMARSLRPPIPNLTLALVGEVAAEQQQQQQQQQQQKRKSQQQQQQQYQQEEGKRKKASLGEKKIFSGLSGIDCLDLSHRGVCTAEDLSALRQLARLDISDNSLTSLSFLSFNLSLHHIKAARNAISSVGPSLKELSNLRVLDLSDNKVRLTTQTARNKPIGELSLLIEGGPS